MKRARTKATDLGDKLRTFAAAYAGQGQRERAEGLKQAADTVDAALAGTTTGLVDDPAVAVMMQLLRSMTSAAERIAVAADRITDAAADLAVAVADRTDPEPGRIGTLIAKAYNETPVVTPPAALVGRRVAVVNGAPYVMGKGERVVLTAIAQHRHKGVTREQLTVLTGYKRSTRDTYLFQLRSAGWVRLEGDRFHAQPEGLIALGDFEQLPTGRALLEHYLRTLPQGERTILREVEAHHGGIDREALSARTGYSRSTRDTYLFKLQARALVGVDGATRLVVLSPELRS